MTNDAPEQSGQKAGDRWAFLYFRGPVSRLWFFLGLIAELLLLFVALASVAGLNNPTGGLSSVEFALEARYRFGNFGVVPFIDAGRLGDSATPSLSHMRYGAGIGGRFYTNFGPMRFDIATPIDRQPGESRISVYISIGQAF